MAFVSFIVLSAIGSLHTQPAIAQQSDSRKLATVRRGIEQWYEQNKKAFLAKDVDAIMALRTPDAEIAADSLVAVINESLARRLGPPGRQHAGGDCKGPVARARGHLPALPHEPMHIG